MITRQFYLLMLYALVFSMATSSCSGSRKGLGYSAPVRDLQQEMATQEAPAETRKIIYNANLTLAVAQPDTTSQELARLAERYAGYASEVGTSRAILRVKSEQLEAALEEIATLGEVQEKRLSGQDVTDQYHDYQIRLDNAEKARDRYLELLAKAEDVEAALKVEKELERLNETIDLLKGRMNRIDHLDEFATITVYLKEKKKPGLLGYVGLGVYQAVKWLFVRN